MNKKLHIRNETIRTIKRIVRKTKLLNVTLALMAGILKPIMNFLSRQLH